MKIVLPELRIQRKIATILSAYDELIENNLRRIKVLEEMAQAIYTEWFVNFRFPGHEKVKLVDSPLEKIPEGWEPSKLGAIAVQHRRAVQPGEVPPETPYCGLADLPQRSLALMEWGEAASARSTKFEFRRGEILFGKIRPYLHKVVVAPVNGICSSDTIVIAPKEPAHSALVACCVSRLAFVDYAAKTANEGTKMPRANWDVMGEYPIAIPPPGHTALEAFAELATSSFALIQNLILGTRALRASRDLLLPRLISGKLDVSELEIDTGGLAT